jgi:hypothetical protein
MAPGPKLRPVMADDGFSRVIVLVAELTLMGTAKGGLPLRGLTMFVVGSWLRIA